LNSLLDTQDKDSFPTGSAVLFSAQARGMTYCVIEQCFSTAGPRPDTGPWHQLYRAARGSPGIGHFSFLSNFHELIFYSGNILRRKIIMNVSKKSDADAGLRKLQYATRFH